MSYAMERAQARYDRELPPNADTDCETEVELIALNPNPKPGPTEADIREVIELAASGYYIDMFGNRKRVDQLQEIVAACYVHSIAQPEAVVNRLHSWARDIAQIQIYGK